MQGNYDLLTTLSEYYGEQKKGIVRKSTHLSGGCINAVMCLELLNGHKVVVKKNSSNYPHLFRIEAEALEILGKTVDRLKKSQQLHIPKPIAYYDNLQDDNLQDDNLQGNNLQENNTGENNPHLRADNHADKNGGERKSAYSYLLLEYLPPPPEKHSPHKSHPLNQRSILENPYSLLGQSLAAIHMDQDENQAKKTYGWKEDNYLGATIQTNRAKGDEKHLWSSFFIKKRIAPLVEKCLEKNLLSKADEILVNRCISTGYKLLSPLDEDLPSLVHGDMWGGNVLIGSDPTNQFAQPCLIDPALHYGHREVDLAMSELFGRLDENFYKSYQETFPLKKGYASRRDFHNLYHLLNHLLLFGTSYYNGVVATLKKYA